MPKRGTTLSNGYRQAIQMLIQTQASARTQWSLHAEQMRLLEKETREQFHRVESELLLLKQQLRDLIEMLRALPDAVRERIGFQPGQTSPPFR